MHKSSSRGTGVDLSKILGGKTKILLGKKVVNSDKMHGHFSIIEGHMPGLPPKLSAYEQR